MTSVFNSMRFDEDPFTCQRQNEGKKAYGFQISHFHESFSNDIMAVKGLTNPKPTCLGNPANGSNRDT